MKNDPQLEFLQRLRTAEGHVKAIIEMTEAGKPCEEVLHQLNAVISALQSAENRLLLIQARRTESVVLNSPSPEERVAELKRLQSLYTKFVQHTNHHKEVVHE